MCCAAIERKKNAIVHIKRSTNHVIIFNNFLLSIRYFFSNTDTIVYNYTYIRNRNQFYYFLKHKKKNFFLLFFFIFLYKIVLTTSRQDIINLKKTK